MKVLIEKENKIVSIKANNVKELLDKLSINPTTVLVVKNNELVPESAKLEENDEIKILSVISGG